ncbi:MAG: porin [Mariprofundaceae bacterium]
MNIKQTLGILVLALALPLSASASGIVAGDDSLIKLLQDKGVISKDEAKDLKKHDKKKFLKIGGRLQVQYKHVDNGTATKNNTDEFLVRRARFTVKGQVTPWGYFKVQPEFGKGKVTLKDAYVGITPESLPGFELDVGNQYAQFSREALNSSKYLHFVERTTTSQFAPFRQMGVNAFQKLWDNKVVIGAGIFNGSLNPGKVGAGALSKNQIYHIDLSGFGGSSGQTTSPMYAVRVDYSPFGKFKKTQGDFDGDLQMEIGANYYSQKLGSIFAAANNGFTDNSAWGIDLGFRGYGASVEAEYIRRTLGFDATNGVVGPRDVDQNAWNVQGGYMMIPGTLELAVRYEQIDFDDQNVYLGTKGEDKVREITVGASYYIKKHHMKIQANYVNKNFTMPVGAADPADDQILVQASYYF